MKILLLSESSGEQSIRYREFFAESGDVAWDGYSPLPVPVDIVLQNARHRSELVAGDGHSLSGLALNAVGQLNDSPSFYYSVNFYGVPEATDRSMVILDLNGNVIDPEIRYFDNLDAYTRYAYPDLGK